MKEATKEGWDGTGVRISGMIFNNACYGAIDCLGIHPIPETIVHLGDLVGPR